MIKQKKILLVGYFCNSADVFTYSTSFLNALYKLGYQVDTFDYRRTPSIWVNFYLKLKCKIFQPDLIFFIKAEKISWKTVRFLQQNSNALLVNFYPDNPFTFWNGNSNSNVLKSLPFFDYFLIWSEQLIPVILAAGARKVDYFPFAFDGDMFYRSVSMNEIEVDFYSSDVCFIGSWDESRQLLLEQLRERMANIRIAIWGNMWHENLPKSSNIKKCVRGTAIYGDNLVKAIKSSKIVLNFIRRQNMSAHNMRTFEIPACNAFMLTQYTDEQAKVLFKEGQSIECFKDLAELIFKIELFLKREDLRSDRIRNGFLNVQEYLMDKQILNFFKKINF